MSDTDITEGRTYIDHQTRLRPDLAYLSGRDSDYETVEVPFVVSNGMWVKECYWSGRVVGVERDEIEEICYTDRNGGRRRLLICDKPFGIVEREYAEPRTYDNPDPSVRRRLLCARQVHKGELGQSVNIPRLSYVRQAFEPGTRSSVTKSRERRRSNRGWVRLIDLVKVTNLEVEDIVFGFWEFSGHLNYRFLNKDQVGGTLLDMVVASSPDDIKGKCPEVFSTTQLEALGMIDDSLEDLWVRRGFADTVLRLIALGVRPEIIQPA